MLRASLSILVALCFSLSTTGAFAGEVSNWGKDRRPGNMIQKVKVKAPSTGKKGGGTGSGTRVAGPKAGPPAEIMIVTQPPGCVVKLETGKQNGSPEEKPDVSRYKFDVQAGSRKLTVSKPGWQTREVMITITPGKNGPVLISLSPEDYNVLFKELILVYGERYKANKDDGSALLHLLYLNRLTKNYREVDRLLAELKANPNIDIREESVTIERFAMEVMPREAPKEDDGSGTEGESSNDPLAGLSGGAGKGGLGTFFKDGKLTSAGKASPDRVLTINTFFYPGFAGYLLSAHLENPESALDYLKGALRAELNAPLLWYDTAIALSGLDRYQESWNAIDRAYRIDKDHAWVLAEHSYLDNLVGRMTDDKTMVKDAEYFGKESIEKDPRYLGGYLNLATYYQLEGRLADAEAQIAAAIALDGNNDDLFGVHGDILVAQGKWDAAETKFQKALEIQPDYAYGMFGLGRVAEGRGNVGMAKQHYSAAANADGEFAEALIALAWLEEQNKEFDGALTHYWQATKSQPGYFDPWFRSGVIYYNHKQYDQAAPFFYEAFKLNPMEPWTNYYLGKISHQKGDKQKALDFYAEFLGLYSGADQFTKEASAFVSFATNIEGMVPTKYQGDGQAAAGDDASFIDQFFGEEEGESSGSGGDLSNNFQPEWMEDEQPSRGNVEASG